MHMMYNVDLLTNVPISIVLVIMTLSGALSALTSGFWGQFGDKHGRTGVIALTIFAMLAT
jgi:MFS family permease